MDRSTDPGFFALLTGSHHRLTGTPLAPVGAGPAWLYGEAPFPVLAHGLGDDPLFIYANRAGQACFEYGWAELMRTPSRLSAEAPDRAERARLMEAVARDGFVSDYAGIRIARSGRRFRIAHCTVWQLTDADGIAHGQAATFPMP